MLARLLRRRRRRRRLLNGSFLHNRFLPLLLLLLIARVCSTHTGGYSLLGWLLDQAANVANKWLPSCRMSLVAVAAARMATAKAKSSLCVHSSLVFRLAREPAHRAARRSSAG